MKKVLLWLVLLFLISNNFVTAQNIPAEQKTGDLTITVNGIKNNRGTVRIGLFDSKESYNDKKEMFRGAKIKAENNMATWQVESIPFGEYAIKAFHDEDGDDKIDTNFLGIPTESYGFSNNAKGVLGPPSFEKAKFYFGKHEMHIEIEF